MGAQITLDGLASVCTAATRDQLAPFIAPLQAAFDEPDFGLITWRARAAFLANAAHESQQFTRLEENLNYSAVGLLKTWPTRFNPAQAESMAKQPERIANYVYAKRGGNGDEASGDGWRFRGRGIFQVTLKENYRAASAAITGNPEILLKNPELLLLPDYAVISAAWYWEINNLASLANAGNFDAVCDLINLGRVTPAQGDAVGYSDRRRLYDAFVAHLT